MQKSSKTNDHSNIITIQSFIRKKQAIVKKEKLKAIKTIQKIAKNFITHKNKSRTIQTEFKQRKAAICIQSFFKKVISKKKYLLTRANNQCPITQENINLENSTSTGCHVFNTAALKRWITTNPTCPMCRKPIGQLLSHNTQNPNTTISNTSRIQFDINDRNNIDVSGWLSQLQQLNENINGPQTLNNETNLNDLRRIQASFIENIPQIYIPRDPNLIQFLNLSNLTINENQLLVATTTTYNEQVEANQPEIRATNYQLRASCCTIS